MILYYDFRAKDNAMKIIEEYISYHGNVRLIRARKYYHVVFNTIVRPGVVYRNEFTHLSHNEAIVKYNAIAKIYKQDAQAKCGFNKNTKVKKVCCESNCPYVLGNKKFWDNSSYDCCYKCR